MGNPNKNLGKPNKKQLISEIQTKTRETQTQNRRNPKNKKTVFLFGIV
jgi:hypothetical protein